jgi:hypothetical protein
MKNCLGCLNLHSLLGNEKKVETRRQARPPNPPELGNKKNLGGAGILDVTGPSYLGHTAVYTKTVFCPPLARYVPRDARGGRPAPAFLPTSSSRD